MSDLIPADEYLRPLSELRMLVFMEADLEECKCGEDKPHFHQVHLNGKQFKRVSDATSTRCADPDHDHPLKDGYEMRSMNLSDRTWAAKLFDGCNSIDNEEKENG